MLSFIHPNHDSIHDVLEAVSGGTFHDIRRSYTRVTFGLAPIPRHILLGAVIGTQIVATFIVVYGVLMAPIGWALALAVWGYAMVYILITDFLKVRLYQLLDRASATIQSGKAVRSYLEG